MVLTANDIRTNKVFGKDLFLKLPDNIKPAWGGFILSHFDKYLESIPVCIYELYELIEDRNRWKEAHQKFGEIRKFGLKNIQFIPETYFTLAEKIAKITYNASGEPSPFDSDSGNFIVNLALETAENLKNEQLVDEVMSAIALFSMNKRIKGDINTVSDLLLYQKIDAILWYDWDPLGINDVSARDEYQSYVPGIFALVKSKASSQDITNILIKIEIKQMGLAGSIERCSVIADKIFANIGVF